MASSRAFGLAPPRSLLDPDVTAMLDALPAVGGSGVTSAGRRNGRTDRRVTRAESAGAVGDADGDGDGNEDEDEGPTAFSEFGLDVLRPAPGLETELQEDDREQKGVNARLRRRGAAQSSAELSREGSTWESQGIPGHTQSIGSLASASHGGAGAGASPGGRRGPGPGPGPGHVKRDLVGEAGGLPRLVKIGALPP